ncbi:MAG: transporter substrate-binding protein [Microbacterium sp.]|jgi:ABC-type nitrate/sulfonate/bicarbonate transport system substrate-binding protein|nr:transporter substrate-binding protein [Microbacterium sp.]
MPTSVTHRRWASASAALVVGALALAGCAAPSPSGSESGGTTSMSLATSWVPMVQFAGSYEADSKGYYSDEGLDVTILPGGPEVDPTATVAAGQAQIGMSNADAVARANEAGADLVIFAAAFQKSPLGILSSEKDPLLTPKDLVGKKIGVPSGDVAIHETLLKTNGVDPASVTSVPVGFDVAPLTSGEVQGQYAFYTEQAVALEQTGDKGAFLFLADYGQDVYANVYYATRETVENDPGLIEKFLTAEIKGWQDAVADPAGAATLAVDDYGKDTGLDLEEQTMSMQREIDLLTTTETQEKGLLYLTDEGIERNVKSITGLGITADENLFDSSFVQKVYDGKSSL